MQKTSLVNMVLMVLLGMGIIVSVLVFSGILPWFGGSRVEFGGEVVLWGTLSEKQIKDTLDVFNEEYEASFVLNYVEKDKDNFDNELVEALASGVGPDLIILPQDLIVRHSNKIFTIPFDSYPLRTFKDNFIQEGELYLSADGVLALPIFIDPIVMYWNRDIFSSAGIARVPLYWDELLTLAPTLSTYDDVGNILRSTVSFGEFVNINNAKDILSMLILQTGNEIVRVGERGYEVSISGGDTESALRFYTQFADSAKKTYSWNRSLPLAVDFFASGKLAIYFGYASELSDIVIKNPHLNFDVAEVPQIRDGDIKATFADVSGIAVLKSSGNISTAFRAAFALSGSNFIGNISRSIKLAPSLRSLLSSDTSDPYDPVFYKSALFSKAFLDPFPRETDKIFQRMIEGVTSGKVNEAGAINRAEQELKRLFK